jgi:hypothetical protein
METFEFLRRHRWARRVRRPTQSLVSLTLSPHSKVRRNMFIMNYCPSTQVRTERSDDKAA